MQAKALGEFAMPKRPQSFINSKFADLDSEAVMSVATKQLERLCVETVAQLFLILDQLQQMNLVGNVEYGDASCRFTIHRRVAILARVKTSTSRSDRGITLSVNRNIFEWDWNYVHG